MINLAILASGNGSNFEAIAKAIKQGYIKAHIKIVISDKKTAFVLKRARQNRVVGLFVDPSKFKTRLEFDTHIIGILKKEKINLVVLAGFMRVLSPMFVRNFKNKILNIHPALLPAFKGENAIERAFRHGCKITGVTVHFVDEKVDNGPIILQDCIKIKQGISRKNLETKIHNIEHNLYPLAIKLFVENRIKIRGRYAEII